MKKFLYSMMTVAVLAFGFTSCNEESEDEIIVHSQTPSAAAAGTYTGTWTRTNTNGVTEGSGTVIIESVSEYVANVTFIDEEKDINATSPANAFWSGNKVYLNQQVKADANALGSSFSVIVDNSALKTSFKVSVKDGRKKVDTIFQFVGNK